MKNKNKSFAELDRSNKIRADKEIDDNKNPIKTLKSFFPFLSPGHLMAQIQFTWPQNRNTRKKLDMINENEKKYVFNTFPLYVPPWKGDRQIRPRSRSDEKNELNRTSHSDPRNSL